MTKIKVDIESDQDIIAAKILLKHANGQTSVENVETTTQEPKMIKRKVENGIDSAFMETY